MRQTGVLWSQLFVRARYWLDMSTTPMHGKQGRNHTRRSHQVVVIAVIHEANNQVVVLDRFCNLLVSATCTALNSPLEI